MGENTNPPCIAPRNTSAALMPLGSIVETTWPGAMPRAARSECNASDASRSSENVTMASGSGASRNGASGWALACQSMASQMVRMQGTLVWIVSLEHRLGRRHSSIFQPLSRFADEWCWRAEWLRWRRAPFRRSHLAMHENRNVPGPGAKLFRCNIATLANHSHRGVVQKPVCDQKRVSV